MLLRRKLLWVDCVAAFTAGLAMLSLSGWLGPVYALPQKLLVAMGVANLAYGAFSFSLARRARRPRSLVVLLVEANATWAALCERAALEWSQREHLLTAR